MATIVVEDGTIVVGANSYIDEAELVTYASDRGTTLTTGTEILLIKAMDYIENSVFIGIKETEDQPLLWPRFDVVVDGYLIANDEIPQLLKDALAEAAMDIDRSIDPLQDINRATLREKVGPLEVEYKESSSSINISQRIHAKLRKLIVNMGQVSRA